MKTTLLVFVLWLILVAFTSLASASYQDVYSLYLERGAYLHEVEMWTFEYSPEVDKGYWIDIQNACDAMWRNDLKHCWYNMLFRTGQEFRVYRWF